MKVEGNMEECHDKQLNLEMDKRFGHFTKENNTNKNIKGCSTSHQESLS